jgi:hypothetical protein
MRTTFFLFISGLLSLYNCTAAFSQTDAGTKYRGIAIYIDYPDVPASVTPARLDSLIPEILV